MLRRRSIVVMTVVGIAATPARAADGLASPLLERAVYDAGSACPTREQFIESVQRYIRTREPVEHGARDLRIRIEGRPPHVLGKLSISSEQGKLTKREFSGPDCEAVARGLAIVVALTIDPRANVFQSTSPTLESNGDELSSKEGRPSEDLPEHGAPPSPPHPAPVDRRPRPPRPSLVTVSPSSKAAARVHFSAEVRAELTSAVVTGALPVLGVAIGMEAAPMYMPRWFRPSLAIGMRQSISKEVSSSRGGADFVLTAATARICPVRSSVFAERLAIFPCVEGEMGALQAEAYGLLDARRTTNLWLNVGASAFGTLRIVDHWFVLANVFVSRPLSRNRFEVDTGELISRAPPAGLTVGLGSSVSF